MLLKNKPSLLDNLCGREASMRTTEHTGPVKILHHSGKKLTIEFANGPRTGAAVLTCTHPEQGLITARGTVDSTGVFTVKDIESQEQRRQAYRVRVALKVEVSLPNGEKVTTETINLSVGGLRLRSCPRLSVDDKVRVRVMIGGEILVVKAEVARAEPGGGCGLRFLELRAGDDQRIGRYLADLQRHKLSTSRR
jgi:hypothetical protein